MLLKCYSFFILHVYLKTITEPHNLSPHRHGNLKPHFPFVYYVFYFEIFEARNSTMMLPLNVEGERTEPQGRHWNCSKISIMQFFIIIMKLCNATMLRKFIGTTYANIFSFKLCIRLSCHQSFMIQWVK